MCSTDSGQCLVVGSREHGNESSGSIQGYEFFDHIKDYQSLVKGSETCSYCTDFSYVRMVVSYMNIMIIKMLSKCFNFKENFATNSL